MELGELSEPLRIPDTVLVLNSGGCPVSQTLIADFAGCYVSAVCLLEVYVWKCPCASVTRAT